jgi:membrane-bound lytic murein transglycosylase D
LSIFWLLCAGCSSHLVKNPSNDLTTQEPTSSGDILPSDAQTSDALAPETPADTPDYSEEEAALLAILNLYDEAKVALENGDYNLAETRIDRAAVLATDIDISSIGDESLSSRYINTLSSLFQDYGRIFKNVDQINQEEPLNWLDQLSETMPEDFKNGKWKDDELREIVRKIALRCDMPIEYNEQVKKAIFFFQTVKKEEMVKWIRRSGRYLPVVEDILEEHDLPLDLAYLAMIESGFNTKAYSRARCSGMWQFSSATGRLYGLKRTQWYDQRRDPIKSTKAAARHLNDLYKIYGDWYLVMAAYNWGPRGVNRQIKRGNTDFWSMNMPRETRNYVPSFMAAVIISKAPELFGFENIEKDAPLTFDTVEVPYTSLKSAAKCAGIDLQTLKDMNTELIKTHTPAGQKYALKIPSGSKDNFLIEYANLPKEKYTPPAIDNYYVKHGDTLSGIAAKFHVSVRSIVLENGIGNRNRLRIGQRLRIPTRGNSSSRSKSASLAFKQASQDEIDEAMKNTFTYTVRRNDSLWIIAVKYKTTINMIQALNNMGGSTRLDPGQKLKIPVVNNTQTRSASSPSPAMLASVVSSNRDGEITYTIQNRDTLYEIAMKYNVSYRDIMRWNKIKNHRTIKPGQQIIIITKS